MQHPQSSDAVAWRRLDMVYAQPGSLVAGSVSLFLVGTVAYVHADTAWLFWIGFAALFVLGGRLALARAYRRRSAVSGAALWARYFIAGTWLTAALWGATSISLVVEPNPFLQIVIASVQMGYLAGAAVRNNPLMVAGYGAIVLCLGPPFVASLVSGRSEHFIFAGFLLINVIASAGMLRFLGRQTLALLTADEERARLLQDLRGANERLDAIARTDALTGLANRRAFDEALQAEWQRAAREERPLSLLLIDIDHFKLFNDALGHPEGDACLKRVAGAIASVVRRPADLAARYGGEEFAMILPHTDTAGATEVAERLRRSLAALALPHPASPFGRVSVSVGVASRSPDGSASAATLIAAADAALYAAKGAGRNRVALSPERPLPVVVSP